MVHTLRSSRYGQLLQRRKTSRKIFLSNFQKLKYFILPSFESFIPVSLCSLCFWSVFHVSLASLVSPQPHFSGFGLFTIFPPVFLMSSIGILPRHWSWPLSPAPPWAFEAFSPPGIKIQSVYYIATSDFSLGKTVSFFPFILFFVILTLITF